MAEGFVDNQDDELLKTDTELDDDNTTDTTDDNIDDSDDTSDNEESADRDVEDSDDDEDEITQEQLDSLDDEEFAAFLNTGKLPKKPTPEKAKVISKPEVNNVKPEETKKEIKASKETKSTEQVDSIDYKTAYETIFKPFKANGKEITPRNLDDVVKLMQMGANYTKKMQTLAPVKRAYESLNKADIKEDDLNFLIDIHKGDVEAIKQLLQRHKIDPIDLDLESNNYKANRKNIASDEDVEFSDVLRDVDSSLPKIQEILNNKWDESSKQKLVKDPKLLRALHEEIELGRFDEVQARVELEKTFGRYQGYSDLEAYIDVVTKMVNEQNKNVTLPNSRTENKPKTTPTRIPDKSKAAPVRAKAKNQGAKMTVQDLLSMSDDDFNKLSINDLV